ncbi:hypothetical protein [Streptomyces sp. NPDC048411]|uniref:TetR/AcrR family transcriptional regulator n=1 Tax=Streptomyces sp. NPDC048411 TaxID=3157206 RepID=UPI003455DA4F
MQPSGPARQSPRRAARTYLHERLVHPLRDRFAAEQVDRPQLRAELAAAAFIGVLLVRSSGAFSELSEVEAEELLPLLRDLLTVSRTAR